MRILIPGKGTAAIPKRARSVWTAAGDGRRGAGAVGGGGGAIGVLQCQSSQIR